MSLSSVLQRGFLNSILSLPESWKLNLSGGLPIRIHNRTLDLDMQLVCKLASLNPDPSNFSPPKARKIFRSRIQVLSNNPLSIAKVETTVIGSIEEPIQIRIYNPDPTRDDQPILLYCHGGGFVIGDIEMTDGVCRYIAHRTPCMVISVNYRLAPEYPFPTAIEDCFMAYEWVQKNGYRLGANPKNIGVAGDSAGGNLALAITRKCLDLGIPLPRFQGLIYPVADLSSEHPSYELFSQGFLLTRKLMRWFKGHYIQKSQDSYNPLASPLLTESFQGYPTTYISTAGFDPLYDEGNELAKKMRNFGVKVIHNDFPSLIHGYFTMGSIIPAARIAIEEFIKFLKTEWGT